MNEYQIHDAIGEISEELIGPVAKLRQKKRYPAAKWVAAAACLCLLLSLPLGAGVRSDMKAESSAGSLMEPEMNMEHVYGGLMDKEDGASDIVVNVSVFRAKVLEVDDKCILVEPLEGEDELRSCDKIYVSFGNLQEVPEIHVDDILQIQYDGMIMETYPGQINSTYAIEIIE